MGRLAGKVALISGGARGQGAAETRLFVREGAAVVFGDVLDDEGKTVEAQIRAAGGQATYVHLNVTQEMDWRAAVATAVQTYGKLSVLVNNAGILFRSTIEDMRRFRMPGKAEVVLPSGPTSLYVEHRSIVDGEEVRAPEALDFHCTLTDPVGKDVPFEPTSSSVSYSFGDYAGRSAFDVHTRAAGTYVLACDASGAARSGGGPRFAVAMGYGVAVWTLVALIGGLVPAGAGTIMFLIVLIKRVRQKRRGAIA